LAPRAGRPRPSVVRPRLVLDVPAVPDQQSRHRAQGVAVERRDVQLGGADRVRAACPQEGADRLAGLARPGSHRAGRAADLRPRLSGRWVELREHARPRREPGALRGYHGSGPHGRSRPRAPRGSAPRPARARGVDEGRALGPRPGLGLALLRSLRPVLGPVAYASSRAIWPDAVPGEGQAARRGRPRPPRRSPDGPRMTSRRSFLRATLATPLLLASGACGRSSRWQSGAFRKPATSRVAILAAASYEGPLVDTI